MIELLRKAANLRMPVEADLENAAVGACLLHPEAAEAVAAILRPSDLTDTRLRTVFEAVLKARRRGLGGLEAVERELSRRGLLDQVGGLKHLLDLRNRGAETPDRAVAAARGVREAAERRALVEQSLRAGVAAADCPLDELRPELFDLAARLREARRVVLGEDRLDIVPADEVTPRPVRWLWRGYIPEGALTIIDGGKGSGKSTIALTIAAAVSTGGPLPTGESVEQGNVLVLEPEDDAVSTTVPRLIAAGADLSRVHLIRGVPTPNGLRMLQFPQDMPVLREAIERCRARLIIFSPITAVILGDLFRDNEVRAALAPLVEAAEETGCAILAIRHHRKSAGDALARGLGSVAFSNIARSVLTVGRDPRGGDGFVLASAACNLAERRPSLGYRIVPARWGDGPDEVATRIEWTGEAEVTADEIAFGPPPAEQAAARSEGEGFLREALANGPRPAREIEREAEEAGIAGITLRRARQKLGVIVRREGFGSAGRFVWSLPGEPGPLIDDHVPPLMITSKHDHLCDGVIIYDETPAKPCPTCGQNPCPHEDWCESAGTQLGHLFTFGGDDE